MKAVQEKWKESDDGSSETEREKKSVVEWERGEVDSVEVECEWEKCC